MYIHTYILHNIEFMNYNNIIFVCVCHYSLLHVYTSHIVGGQVHCDCENCVFVRVCVCVLKQSVARRSTSAYCVGRWWRTKHLLC